MSAATIRISQAIATRADFPTMSLLLQSQTSTIDAAYKHLTKLVSISVHSWLKDASLGLALPTRNSRFNTTASTVADVFGATLKAQTAFLLVGQANFLNEFLEPFVRAERVEHRHRLEINNMLRVFCVDLLQ